MITYSNVNYQCALKGNICFHAVMLSYKLYNLRPRALEFKLTLKADRNYVPRLPYKDVY